ncbi:glycosyl hydrolase family 28-related protein [Cohnella rhizosphaerae]|uniref:Fibronectin type-III domain-containing protein n=1 Tax=Cohnella rhizosphaerae TaxID=1457232 RepID=A0A9X4L1M6_9BACL|nr:glycosyl hydrolase family 28-related protein [Cohnella rhizosphaerae]MDG0814568.1 hypothetical protein [Cohnella rhizosphaerae]
MRIERFGLIRLLLCLTLVLSLPLPGSSPAYADDPPATTAEFVGVNTTAKGSWVGNYGGEGYILPFFTATSASGRDPGFPAYKPADLASLPSYVSAYTMDSGTYNVTANPSTDPTAPTNAAGTVRKAIQIYDYSAIQYSFTLTGTAKHLFAVYAASYSNTAPQTIELRDTAGQLLDSRLIDTKSGVYALYEVSGSFRVRILKTGTNNQAVLSGFFFDAMPALGVSDVAATVSGRTVELTWDNSLPASGVSVWRKGPTEAQYSELAVLSGSADTYTDTGLSAGSAYLYKLRSAAGGKLSEASATVTANTPVYDATALSLTTTGWTDVLPGTSIAISAALSRSDDHTPIAGETVAFELRGPYVGTWIDGTIGTAVTDAYGVASLAYAPPYAGSYAVHAVYKGSDTLTLDGSEDESPLTVEVEAWERPPVVLKASDAVKPGELLNLDGYGLYEDDQEAVYAEGDGIPTGGPPAGALPLPIVQSDEDGYYAVTRLPDTADAGTLRVWIRNEWGWSDPIRVNLARPQFISEYETAPGLEITLVGRNFDPSEFGGAGGGAQVRLVDTTTAAAYAADVHDVDPYAITFDSDLTPAGEYWVEARHSSADAWARLSSGQTLSVQGAVYDPLEMGVAWADGFNWSRTYSIADYGAVADDAGEDTAAIQAAIDAVKTAGGGVVLVPEGRYVTKTLKLPADVVLRGEDAAGSVLAYSGNGTTNFIESKGDGQTVGRQGVADLTLTMQDETISPDVYLWLGHVWGDAVYDQDNRTASNIFVKGVRIDAPLTKPLAGRGTGTVIVGKERVLFDDNEFSGNGATFTSNYVTEYSSMRGNTLEYGTGVTASLGAYSIVTGNHLIGHPEADADNHGFSVRSYYYLADNVIEHNGTLDHKHNDGEAVMAEVPGGYFNFGEVLSASSDSLVVAPNMPLNTGATSGYHLPTRYGRLSVVITDGRGVGQYRAVTSMSGNTIETDGDWDIVPDRTSKFSLVLPNANGTMYRNTVYSTGGGMQVYGNGIDVVVADNDLTTSGGAFASSFHVPGQNRFNMSYFVRFDRNEIEDILTTSLYNGLGVHGTKSGYGIQSLGIEIRENHVKANLLTDTPGIYVSAKEATVATPPVLRNTVIENNVLENLTKGILLTDGIKGQVLSGNQFVNVAQQIADGGSIDTVILP